MEIKEIIHNDRKYFLQVLKLDQSGFIYIGDSSARMENINLVHASKYV